MSSNSRNDMDYGGVDHLTTDLRVAVWSYVKGWPWA